MEEGLKVASTPGTDGLSPSREPFPMTSPSPSTTAERQRSWCRKPRCMMAGKVRLRYDDVGCNRDYGPNSWMRAGQSQFLTSPVLAKPLKFSNLTLDDPNYDEDLTGGASDSDTRLMEMLAAQAAHSAGPGFDDEDEIATSEKLSDDEKRAALQKALHMAASNGNVDQVNKILGGRAKQYVDINASDEDGTPALIYASCFVRVSGVLLYFRYADQSGLQGHEGVVHALIDAGADVNKQDRNNWSALMWAMTNRHKGIAKLLLDHGASAEAKTSSGRTAFDFVAPDSEISFYLHDSGYNIGNAGVTDDFYNPGLSQDRFEEELAENEMRRRMMMESARDLEVDLGNVGMDDQPEVGTKEVFLQDLGQDADERSLWTSSKRSNKSSIGPIVTTTRCSSSRRKNWTDSLTSSSQT